MTSLELFISTHYLLSYLVVFFGMFVEGEGVILLASIFAWQGRLEWSFLALAVVSGTIIGDILWYLTGKYLRGTKLGIWLDNRYEKQGDWVNGMIVNHYGRFAILSKFLYFTTRPTIFLVGWHEFSFKKFLKITAFATLVWAAGVLAVGYFFGFAIHLIGFRKIVRRIEIFAVILFGVIFLAERLLKKLLIKKLPRA